MVQQIRFATLSALVICVTFPLGACDIFGGSDDSAPTVTRDSLQIAEITPEVGADLETTDTSFTVTFTRPVDSSEFTRTDVEPGTGDRHLVDHIGFFPMGGKDLTPGNTLPIDIEFEEDRKELTLTPQESLEDGIVYRLDLGDMSSDRGFYDPRFKSENGGRYAENPNFDENLNFSYSVGMSDGQPATPSMSFADQDGDDETINDEGELDYRANQTVRAELQVDEVDNSGAEVKGYEVYYRSQNQVGRTGGGDQFVKATVVDPEAEASDFEDHDGIIPADAAFGGDGPVGFSVWVFDYPLAAKDGSYGPIEWKVRAVSINNIRGDFSDVLTTGDNVLPRLTDAEEGIVNDAGDVETIDVFFSEALDAGTVNSNRFTVEDNEGSTVDLDDANVENEHPSDGDSHVELTLSSPTESVDNYDVEVDDDDTTEPVTDLAGNGVHPAFDDEAI